MKKNKKNTIKLNKKLTDFRTAKMAIMKKARSQRRSNK